MFKDKLESLLVIQLFMKDTLNIQSHNRQTSYSHISNGEDVLERIFKVMSNMRFGPNLISNAKNLNCNGKRLNKCSKF